MTSTFGCPHCGKANPLAAVFCGACGAYLRGMDATELTRAALRPDEITPEVTPENAPENVPEDAPRDTPEDAPAQSTPAQSTDEARAPNDPLESQPWLRPDFDSPAPPSQSVNPPAIEEQPWLDVEKAAQDAERSPQHLPQRLISGLQGLIEPLETDHSLLQPESIPPGTTPSGTTPSGTTPSGTAGVADLPFEMRRDLRQLFATDLPIREEPTQNSPDRGPLAAQGRGLWRRGWIYGLLLAALLFALWTSNAAPDSRPHSWPGVAAAYSAIDSLPEDSVVLVNWAYDPASAGEMDLAALPVVEHLVEKSAHLLVISQLPGGPASARRLIAVARAGASQAALSRQLGDSLVEGGYLPGGVASLSLLGQAPAQGLPVDIQGRSVRNRAALRALDNASPRLLLVVAARSEEVQRWIEQIQPLNRAPLVAVTTAAVDPAIRPYVDSGQIAGLVSGYAGGIEYRDLLADVMPRASQEARRRHISGQNWALVVLLLVVAVGNLVGLAERREP